MFSSSQSSSPRLSIVCLQPRARPGLVASACVATLLAVAGCSGGSSGGGFDARIDPYIVAIQDPQAPVERDETIDTHHYTDDGYECTVLQRYYSHGGEVYLMLDPLFDTIWPGGAVRISTLNNGIPDPIVAQRSGGSVVFSNLNGTAHSSVRLSEVTLANVTQAINSIIAVQPDAFPANLTISVARVRSLEEIQIEIGASASFFDLFEVSSGFQLNQSEAASAFLVKLEQRYYSIAFERPSDPHDFFAPGVRLEDLVPYIDRDNPAGYVSEVTYGSVYYLLIQATNSAEALRSTIEANFILGDIGGGIGYVTNASNLSISAYAYGGDQAHILSSIFAGLSSLTSFVDELRSAAALPFARPLAYKVRSIATNQVIRSDVSAAYTYNDCHLVGDCIPALLSPNSGATLDNGCLHTPNAVTWSFSWTPCGTASAYEIEVRDPSGNLVGSETLGGTAWQYSGSSAFTNTSGWHWRVRANIAGTWRPWSQNRAFSLEAENTDCTTGVRFFSHPSYQNDTWFIQGDIPNMEAIGGLDDNIDSLQLVNVSAVTLFEHPNYQGQSFTFNHDCPNVQNHSPHAGAFPLNRASSARIVR